MISMAVLAVGLLFTASVIVESAVLRRMTRDEASAHTTSRNVLERFRNGDLETAFTYFKDNPDLHKEFMHGLGSRATIRIRYPQAMLDDAFKDREVTTGDRLPTLSRYLDTDDDGESDLVPDGKARAGLLPVQVIVRWKNQRARRELRRNLMVTRR